MLRLRPYKACDAAAIVSWIGDETAFRKWSADRFEKYPVTAQDLNGHYAQMEDSDSFYEMTAFDEGGPAGHLIMRFTDEEKTRLRFGFVIVDSSRRGRGLGREMLSLAERFAFEFLGAQTVTLGVFENNPGARRCYLAAGFRDSDEAPKAYRIADEDWVCLEMVLTKAEWERNMKAADRGAS